MNSNTGYTSDSIRQPDSTFNNCPLDEWMKVTSLPTYHDYGSVGTWNYNPNSSSYIGKYGRVLKKESGTVTLHFLDGCTLIFPSITLVSIPDRQQLETEYLIAQNEQGFMIGEQVAVSSTSLSYYGGWKGAWNYDMVSTLHSVGTIRAISDLGITLRLQQLFSDSVLEYTYPFFVLRRISVPLNFQLLV